MKIKKPLILNFVEFNKKKENSIVLKMSSINAYKSGKYYIFPFYKDISRFL